MHAKGQRLPLILFQVHTGKHLDKASAACCRYDEFAVTIMQALLGTAGTMLRSEDPAAMKVSPCDLVYSCCSCFAVISGQGGC